MVIAFVENEGDFRLSLQQKVWKSIGFNILDLYLH